MNRWTVAVGLAVGFCFSQPSFPQASSRFVQAELRTGITAKTARVGDSVKAVAFTSATLPNGLKIIRGAEILGQVRAVDAIQLVLVVQVHPQETMVRPLLRA